MDMQNRIWSKGNNDGIAIRSNEQERTTEESMAGSSTEGFKRDRNKQLKRANQKYKKVSELAKHIKKDKGTNPS